MKSAMKAFAVSSAFALTFVLLACDSRPIDQTPSPTPTTAPSAAPAMPLSKPQGTTTQTNTAAKPDPVENEVLAVTRKWNEALAKRDAKALDGLYAKKVRLYLVDMPRENAVKAKADALEKAKDYTQSISFVEIDTRKKPEPKALFHKKWTANGKDSLVLASLTFTKEDGKWVIKDESDAPTDQRRARAAANAEGCESLVQKLVTSTAEAQALLNGPKDPAHGHNTNGTRLGGGPPESPTYGVAIHENHDDHVATLMWFDVDPKTGNVTTMLDPDKPLKADATLTDKVKAACK